MQVFVKHFRQLTAAEYHRIVQAREAVFYLEQHVTCPDADDTDLESVFMWFEIPPIPGAPGQVVAFLRIIPAGIVYEEASIGRVLVSASYRRQGLCRRMMHQALDYIVSQWGPQPIRISAQEYLIPFYTSLGFVTVSDRYLEAGIPHVKMLRAANLD